MSSVSDSDLAATGNRPWLGRTALWTGLLILTMMVWGNSFIAIKYVVGYVTPLELVTVRFVPVALIFALLLLPTRGRQVWRLLRAESWRLALPATACFSAMLLKSSLTGPSSRRFVSQAIQWRLDSQVVWGTVPCREHAGGSGHTLDACSGPC